MHSVSEMITMDCNNRSKPKTYNCSKPKIKLAYTLVGEN